MSDVCNSAECGSAFATARPDRSNPIGDGRMYRRMLRTAARAMLISMLKNKIRMSWNCRQEASRRLAAFPGDAMLALKWACVPLSSSSAFAGLIGTSPNGFRSRCLRRWIDVFFQSLQSHHGYRSRALRLRNLPSSLIPTRPRISQFQRACPRVGPWSKAATPLSS